MNPENRIYVAGHRGLAGSAILRALQAKGFQNLITRTREELDLTDAEATRRFFEQERPQYVFLAAAKVGGIHANNTFPAEFLRENLLIQTHVLHESWRVGVKKLLFLGSSCIYPRLAPQPIPESALADRRAGIDQRSLRRGQDSRHPGLSGVSKAVRIQLHRGDADQPLRASRQLPSGALTRPPCPDPTLSRGPARWPPGGHRVGQWNATPRVPAQ